MTSKRQRRPWQRLLFGECRPKRKANRLSSHFGRRLIGENLEDRRMLAAGDPDPTFGTGTGASTGEVIIPISPNLLTDNSTSSLIDSQGRVILGGTSLNPSSPTNTDFAVTRLNQDGSVDTTFGSGGKLILPIGLSEDVLTDMAFQANGSIILAGYYNVSGNDLQVDPLFDDQVFSSNRAFTAEDLGLSIRITSPGPWLPGTYKIIDVNNGVATLDQSPAPVGTPSGSWFADKYDLAVVRLTPNGQLDTTFGLNGFMLVPVAPFQYLNQQVDVPVLNTIGKGVAVDSLNRIIVAGYTEVPLTTSTKNFDFTVMRLLGTTGALDTTFNDGSAAQGKVITAVGTSVNDFGNSVAIDSSNNIVVAGSTAGANNSNFAFAKYRAADGSLDTSFGTGGKLSVDFGTANQVRADFANSVIILPDTSIVAAGTTGSTLTNAPTDLGVVKLTSSGVLVPTFGTNGRTVYSISSGKDTGNSVAFQQNAAGTADDRLVVGGTTENGTNSDFVVARFDANTGAIDPTWGTNGRVVTAFGTRNDFGTSVAIVPTTAPLQNGVSNAGKVVMSGSTDITTSGQSDFDFAAVRYENSGPSLPFLNISSVTQTEGNAGTTQFIFTVTISAAPTAAVSVNYATANGTAIAGTDYTATNGVLNFPTNSTASRQITVLVTGDTTPEIDETFTVNLSGLTPTTAAQLGTSTATGTITNDDAGISIVSTVIKQEGNTSANNFMVFPVTLSAPPAGAVTVTYQLTAGTAQPGTDYTDLATPPGTLTFPAGGPYIQNISVPIVGDTVGEADETFTVQLLTATGAAIIAGADTSTGTIRNDDGVVVNLSIANPAAILEGDSGSKSLIFTVTRSGGSSTVVVDFATANGTATAGSDYTATTGKVTFSGSTTTRTITVPIIGDVLAENTETFQVNLSNPTGGATITNGSATGTILDNDLDSAEIVVSDARITEGETTQNMIFLVQLSKPLSQQATVQYYTLNGGAVSGSDFTGIPQGSPQTLTFAPNTTLQTIAIPILGDGIVEGFEEFVLKLQNALVSAPATISIRDGDAKGSIVDNDLSGSIYVNDVTVSEPAAGTVNAVFTVALSSAVNTQVKVNFTTAAGTAAAPGDFNATSGTVTFAPGVTSRTVTVQVLADGLAEASENFFVNLSSPTNGRIFDGQGVGTILDSSAATAGDTVVDDGDGGYSQTGTWSNGSNTTAYQLDFKTAQPGNGSAQVTWSASLTAGTYEVFTRWVAFSNRASNATYTILQNNTPLRTAIVNQQFAPNDVSARGVTWESLGTVTLNADGVLRVRLNNNANGLITADAVRFVPVTQNLQFAPLSASLVATQATAAASQPSQAAASASASSAPAAGSLAAYVAALPTLGSAPSTLSFIGPRRITAQDAALSSVQFLEDLQLEWLK